MDVATGRRRAVIAVLSSTAAKHCSYGGWLWSVEKEGLHMHQRGALMFHWTWGHQSFCYTLDMSFIAYVLVNYNL
jgi:hypothetical protein